jgi:hypothetical protein
VLFEVGDHVSEGTALNRGSLYPSSDSISGALAVPSKGFGFALSGKGR